MLVWEQRLTSIVAVRPWSRSQRLAGCRTSEIPRPSWECIPRPLEKGSRAVGRFRGVSASGEPRLQRPKSSRFCLAEGSFERRCGASLCGRWVQTGLRPIRTHQAAAVYRRAGSMRLGRRALAVSLLAGDVPSGLTTDGPRRCRVRLSTRLTVYWLRPTSLVANLKGFAGDRHGSSCTSLLSRSLVHWACAPLRVCFE